MKVSLDFAFEGFRIIRNRPGVIPIWGVFLLLGFGLAYGLFFAMAWQPFYEFVQLARGAGIEADPTAILRLYSKIGPAYLLMVFLLIVVQAVTACAVYRIVLGRPETSFGALRFGADELRQIGAGILFFLLFIGIEIVWEIIGMVIGGILTLVLSAAGPKVAPLGMAAGGLIVFAGIIWTLIKLSLFGPQTFDQKKLNLFGSWKLTKGNSLTLFLGYVIAALLTMVVEVLCLIIFVVVVYAVTGGHFEMPQAGPDMIAQMAKLAVPVLVAFSVLMLILMPLIMAIFIGAPAAAYKQLAGTTVKTADAVF